MLNYTLTDHDQRLIENRKREYWAQKGIGDEYHALALSDDPFVRAKNLVELSLLRQSLTGSRILDAGAGTGRFLIPLQGSGFDVTACDISLEMLRTARKHGAKRGLSLRVAEADVERMPFPDGHFDSVYSITVLRHFPRWRDIARSCMRLVRPGGRFIFDLASGEQALYGEAHAIPGMSLRDDVKSAEDFQAAATVEMVAQFAREEGWTLVHAQAHDVLGDNRLLRHLWGADKERLEAACRKALQPAEALLLYEWFSRRVLPHLSPVFAPSLWLVIEKGPSDEVAGRPDGETLEAILRASGELPHLREEYDLLAASEAAQNWADFAREHILSRLPAGIFRWTPEAGSASL